jgi:hypothetical protein
MSAFPLSRAYLCVDCESVGEGSRVCEKCASTSVLSLAIALNPNDAATETNIVRNILDEVLNEEVFV